MAIVAPDLPALVDPLLGTPYAEHHCRSLVEFLFAQGFGLDLSRESGTDLNQVFQEVWYRGSAVDPQTLIQPWDLLLMDEHDLIPVGSHVGVAIDHQQFVHARTSETGVALGRLRTWKPRLLQVARYRELL
jgi:cell wall-associated NlpC family hydrolase